MPTPPPLRLSLPLLFVLLSLLNGVTFAQSAYTENPDIEGNGNHVVGPEYSIDPDLTDCGNPQGQLFEFSMPLAERC